MITLAWRPFLDPIDAHSWWFLLLIPLALGISMSYRAVKLRSLDRYWSRVAIMTAQIVLSIVALAIVSFLVIQVINPALAPMPE